MDEVERYLFDVRGYLVVEEVLSPEEVEAINRLIDSQGLPGPELGTMGARFGGFLEWDEAFLRPARP